MRRFTIGVAAAVAMFAGLAGISTAPAGASPAALYLPGGAAFAVLGHSCGGIQQQAYATGFDPASGYPTGDAYVSTTCGGSGRDGGGHSTTYAAWVGVTWDYTSVMVSYSVLTSPPSVDPAFSAFDSYGNEVYNQSNNAYLTLSPTFVPPPRLLGISATYGPAAGGTPVTLSGTGFTGATAVSFGTTAATFTVTNDQSIAAVSPAAAPGTVNVTVTTAGGTSAAFQFTFIAAPVVTGVSPNRGPYTGGTAVTITGSNFTGASAVSFSGNGVGFTVNSDTSITATTPALDGPDNEDVIVTTAGGTSATSSADQFNFTTPVRCAKLAGTTTGVMTVSACTPVVVGSKLATGPALAGPLTWAISKQTTVLSLNPLTSPGRGACPLGSTEEDLSGVVSGGTSTFTGTGDPVSAQICVSRTGHLSLVKYTTFSL
jgi:hypothetical protein